MESPNLTLEIGESAYFRTYENVDVKSGEDLVRNYLRSNQMMVALII